MATPTITLPAIAQGTTADIDRIPVRWHVVAAMIARKLRSDPANDALHDALDEALLRLAGEAARLE